jgi:Ni/Co efflux regulator RcnB
MGLGERGLIMKNEWDDAQDKRKERERKERIQHPHVIESRKHWDLEQQYYDYFKDKTIGQEDVS